MSDYPNGKTITRKDVDDDDREIIDTRTGATVGWIVQGRTRIGSNGVKTEWGFEPAADSQPMVDCGTRGISPAYVAAQAEADRIYFAQVSA